MRLTAAMTIASRITGTLTRVSCMSKFPRIIVPSCVLCYGDSVKAAAVPSVFERRYPGYDATRLLDEVRARDYQRLDASGCTYLDYTAANVYARSQLEQHFAVLR